MHPTPERQHYNVTLAVLTLAGIAFALQQTLIVPALPTLQRELDTTTTWVTWLLTGLPALGVGADAAAGEAR